MAHGTSKITIPIEITKMAIHFLDIVHLLDYE